MTSETQFYDGRPVFCTSTRASQYGLITCFIHIDPNLNEQLLAEFHWDLDSGYYGHYQEVIGGDGQGGYLYDRPLPCTYNAAISKAQEINVTYVNKEGSQ